MLSNTNMLHTDTKVSQYESQCFTVNMPGKNNVRDVTNLQVQLISILIKMAKKDIPVVAVWFNENDSQIYGTRYLKNLISLIEKVDVENAIKLDLLNLASPDPDEPMLEIEENIPDRSRAKTVYKDISQKSNPDLLPYPLSCMNRSEIFLG